MIRSGSDQTYVKKGGRNVTNDQMWLLQFIGFIVGCDRMVVKIFTCLCNQFLSTFDRKTKQC